MLEAIAYLDSQKTPTQYVDSSIEERRNSACPDSPDGAGSHAVGEGGADQDQVRREESLDGVRRISSGAGETYAQRLSVKFSEAVKNDKGRTSASAGLSSSHSQQAA